MRQNALLSCILPTDFMQPSVKQPFLISFVGNSSWRLIMNFRCRCSSLLISSPPTICLGDSSWWVRRPLTWLTTSRWCWISTPHARLLMPRNGFAQARHSVFVVWIRRRYMREWISVWIEVCSISNWMQAGMVLRWRWVLRHWRWQTAAISIWLSFVHMPRARVSESGYM